jgi:hypothetical protein
MLQDRFAVGFAQQSPRYRWGSCTPNQRTNRRKVWRAPAPNSTPKFRRLQGFYDGRGSEGAHDDTTPLILRRQVGPPSKMLYLAQRVHFGRTF